ncbi:LacI family DNA-binding transcriptional regulator [Mangrovicella endophytica]|uniref:LacI family DNA-binding transcriptional regulator n=1 Tax=Mangrovicella endophytica TaxID=2066697 RepID=UPI000C9E6885|nr:LacI family DNA-binding transcriptional regulator [Mangrovicella endophytica]
MTGAPAPSRKARRKGSGVTMAEVAAAAGVSMQTVSRALRSPQTVTAETRKAIEAAIEKTHYVHNLAASHLASSKSNTVAAVIPTISASIFAETIQHFSDVLNAANYQIFLGNTDYGSEREEAVIRSLLGRRPDGLFVIGAHHTRSCIALMRRAGIPVVEGWDLTARPIDGMVGFSSAAAITELARRLAGTGRRRIVFAGVLRHGDSRAAERRDGFVAAMAELFPHEAPRLCIAGDLPLEMESGVTLLERVRRQDPDADAIMFSSDIIASGAILAASRQGIAVPEDIAITGFGDFELARHLNPALTTVAIPAALIGQEAGRLLLESMSGRKPQQKRIDVGFRLMIRQSG